MTKLHKIETVAAAAKTLRVLAHPVRMKVVEFLGTEEKYVGAIQKHIKQEQAVTSQHLKLLLVNGLVNKRRDKNFIYYRQNTKVLKGIGQLINDIS